MANYVPDSPSDCADFAAFCANATYGQLINIRAKESEAGRKAYVALADAEIKLRDRSR